MKDFGPGRRETRVYLMISICGLVLLGVAVGVRGMAGIVAFEIVAISVLFFGGTLVWAVRRLMRLR